VADLGLLPLSCSLILPERAGLMEAFHPLRAVVCGDCRLVQLAEPVEAGLQHAQGPSLALQAQDFARAMAERWELDAATPVVQIGSADGALLRHFAVAGIPVTGVEARAELADAAAARGIPTEVAAFGAFTARRLRAAGHEPALICAGEALARATDPHDIAAGLRILLAPGGVATADLPHLLRLLSEGEFDAFDHRRVCFPSLLAAEILLSEHGLVPFDVEELPPALGGLRLHLRHQEDPGKPATPSLLALQRREAEYGLDGMDAYRAFAARPVETKCALLDFLVGAQRAGRSVAAHGSSAAGNVLLNYCGVGPELLPFTVDPDPARQGKLLPGTRIPVRGPDAILHARPDFVLVLDRAQRGAVVQDMRAIRRWGARFVAPIPRLEVF
jgi:hypothetical protein